MKFFPLRDKVRMTKPYTYASSMGIEYLYGWIVGQGVKTHSRSFPETSLLVRLADENGKAVNYISNIELSSVELYDWTLKEVNKYGD